MVNKHKNGDRQKGGGEEGAAEARVVRRVENGGGDTGTLPEVTLLMAILLGTTYDRY